MDDYRPCFLTKLHFQKYLHKMDMLGVVKTLADASAKNASIFTYSLMYYVQLYTLYNPFQNSFPFNTVYSKVANDME